MKVVVNRDKCIGAGSCVDIAPGVYELDVHKKAVVIDGESVDLDTLITSADGCPTLAISVYDDDGTLLFPEQ